LQAVEAGADAAGSTVAGDAEVATPVNAPSSGRSVPAGAAGRGDARHARVVGAVEAA
jgi:hypothetical protein